MVLDLIGMENSVLVMDLVKTIIFGADLSSSSSHDNNKKNNILVLL